MRLTIGCSPQHKLHLQFENRADQAGWGLTEGPASVNAVGLVRKTLPAGEFVALGVPLDEEATTAGPAWTDPGTPGTSWDASFYADALGATLVSSFVYGGYA